MFWHCRLFVLIVLIIWISARTSSNGHDGRGGKVFVTGTTQMGLKPEVKTKESQTKQRKSFEEGKAGTFQSFRSGSSVNSQTVTRSSSSSDDSSPFALRPSSAQISAFLARNNGMCIIFFLIWFFSLQFIDFLCFLF